VIAHRSTSEAAKAYEGVNGTREHACVYVCVCVLCVRYVYCMRPIVRAHADVSR